MVKFRYVIGDVFQHRGLMRIHVRLHAWACRHDPEVWQWVNDVKTVLALMRCWRWA